MTNPNTRLAPNRAEVVSKVIDGEAIVINLSNGIYYSMDRVAGLVWDLIDRHASMETILNTVAASYGVSQSQAAVDVDALVAQLLEEGLVHETNDEPGSEPAAVHHNGERLNYEAPVLNIYRDMGDLLALDPPQPGLEDTPWKVDADEQIDRDRK